ncbi:hypothetical protein HYU22_04960 [Candidatus Woesearchaeota archaeon]|nr:hypothetical protein [Candidatus Woesearchaeota archaeon]
MGLIKEHSITLKTLSLPSKINRQMETFYNPLMISNRNIAILLLNTLPLKNMNLADPLAGSGIRSLRFLKELAPVKINHLFINDLKENFPKVFQENMALNKIKSSNLSAFNEDANLFLLNRVNDSKKPANFCGYFDYIDLDPFGSPNHFLSAAIARIARGGIIAVTATDTAALTGTYPKVTRRKYWSEPLRNYLMHETGLRILIQKVQLLGVQFDKALRPLLAYSKDHYYRVYFQSEIGKEKCDALLKEHHYFLFCAKCLNFKTSYFNNERCRCHHDFTFAGPLWTGPLLDQKLISHMATNNPFPEEQKLMDILHQESMINVMGFYDSHVLAQHFGKEPVPLATVLKAWKGVRTHFSPTGVKTTKTLEEVARLYS